MGKQAINSHQLPYLVALCSLTGMTRGLMALLLPTSWLLGPGWARLAFSWSALQTEPQRAKLQRHLELDAGLGCGRLAAKLHCWGVSVGVCCLCRQCGRGKGFFPEALHGICRSDAQSTWKSLSLSIFLFLFKFRSPSNNLVPCLQLMSLGLGRRKGAKPASEHYGCTSAKQLCCFWQLQVTTLPSAQEQMRSLWAVNKL